MSDMTPKAARPWGKALLFQAQSALYDEVADQTVALFDELTGPSVNPQYTPGSIGEDSGWEISQVTEGAYAGTGLIKLQDAAGAVTYVNFATGVVLDGEKVQLTAAQAQAAVDDANAIAVEPDGGSVMAKLPDAVKSVSDTVAKTQSYDAAKSANKVALQEMFTKVAEPPTDEVKKRIRVAVGNQDRSRVSKEYHEWKYCCIDSNNYSIASTATGAAWSYQGSDGLSTGDEVSPALSNAPPYHIWIKHDELREVIKYVRRFRRARGRCGGKALWEEQGHADKDAAIVSDLTNSFEYGNLVTAWVDSTDDFDWDV